MKRKKKYLALMLKSVMSVYRRNVFVNAEFVSLLFNDYICVCVIICVNVTYEGFRIFDCFKSLIVFAFVFYPIKVSQLHFRLCIYSKNDSSVLESRYATMADGIHARYCHGNVR